MRLAAQERRRKGNEPQTTKVAHHTTYPRHEVFEVEIKDEDADAVGTSPESTEVVEFGVMPAVSRLQPANVGLDGVGGAAGGVSGGQGMEVEVMRDAERGCRGASHDGLFAEFGYEFLFKDDRRNQRFDKVVDELGCFQGNVNRVFAGEIDFGGFGIPVGTAVADGADGAADRQDVRAKGKCVELLEEFGVFAVAGNTSQFRDMVGDPLQTDAQKGAGRSRRKVGDALSFDEEFADVGRHIFVGFDANGGGEDDFVVLPKRHVEATLANAYVNKPTFREAFEVFGRDEGICLLQTAKELVSLQCRPVHVTGNAAVRASEMRSADFWRNN